MFLSRPNNVRKHVVLCFPHCPYVMRQLYADASAACQILPVFLPSHVPFLFMLSMLNTSHMCLSIDKPRTSFDIVLQTVTRRIKFFAVNGLTTDHGNITGACKRHGSNHLPPVHRTTAKPAANRTHGPHPYLWQ